MKMLSSLFTTMLALIFMCASCSEDAPGYVVPAPGTGSTPVSGCVPPETAGEPAGDEADYGGG